METLQIDFIENKGVPACKRIGALQFPTLFLRQSENSLVVLDEIHRVPELFSSLRGIIDQGRRTGHGKGRFLILGSASIDLLRQSSESLAGRITYIHMGPFNALELPSDESTLLQLWTRGGFPGSYLAPNDTVSLRWRDDFIRTYLERDVPQFGPRVPAGVLERLWIMLAHGQGTLLNSSRLASALQKTLRLRYSAISTCSPICSSSGGSSHFTTMQASAW